MPLPLGGRVPRVAFVLAVVAALAPGASHAASARAFVASNGIDGAGCTRQAPCRTLQHALGVLPDGAEIVVLDSAGYGQISIAQSVSIVAPKGVYAGISVASGVGVDIASPGIRVSLEGLTIQGVGTGTTGVRFVNGAELRIVGCTIRSMTDTGIVASGAGRKIIVTDTRLEGNHIGATFTGVVATLDRVDAASGSAAGSQTGLVIAAQTDVTVRHGSISNQSVAGIVVDASGSGPTKLAVDSTLIAANTRGVDATAAGPQGKLTMAIVRSGIVQNVLDGLRITASAPAVAEVMLSNSDISFNGAPNFAYAGVLVQGSGAELVATNNTVVRNGVGFAQAATASFQSRGDNTLIPYPTATSGTIGAAPGY